MTSKRLFYGLSASLVILAIATVTGTLFGAKFLEQRTRGIVDMKLEKAALDDQQVSLIQAKQDIEKYQELEQIAKSIVPQEKDQARTVREIIKLADESNVPIGNISFPASTLGQAPARAPAPAPPPAGESAAAPKPAPSVQTSQVIPVEGIPGLFQLEINVQSVGAAPVLYNDMLNFLSKLQKNRRTSHITNLSVTPSKQDRNTVTFTLVINAYIKP